MIRCASMALFMVVEYFKNNDAAPVYRRFRERGRMAPEGLIYVSSWVDTGFEMCFQLMETDGRRGWTLGWQTGPTSSILRCMR